MRKAFKVGLGDLFLQATFAEPAFSIFRDIPALYQKLYMTLNRHGLKLADIKTERDDGSLADLCVTCSLFDFSTTVRVRLDRVEVQCVDTTRVTNKQFEEAALSVLQVFNEPAARASYQAFIFAINVHGTIADSSPKEFLSRFVANTPSSLGPPLGAGAVFYFGADDGRLTSSITVDLSARQAEAVFLRVHTVWDATKLSPADLSERIPKHFDLVLEQLNLSLDDK
jgi:hypothetical protein